MHYSRSELEKRYDAGEKMKFLFFWGHQRHSNDEVTKSCFSQWWLSPFTVDGNTYATAEHWMMAEKARLFGDFKTLEKILDAENPGKAKKLGRQVQGFDNDIWNAKRFQIVLEGNLHKFRQHPELRNFLLGTKNRVIVEASPVDAIWGIGMEGSHQFAAVPPKWRGLNLLGFALMEVRDLLGE